MQSRLVFPAIVLVVALLAACTDDRASEPELVSVPNFVGRNVVGATELAERYGLDVDIRSGDADPVGNLPDSVRTLGTADGHTGA